MKVMRWVIRALTAAVVVVAAVWIITSVVSSFKDLLIRTEVVRPAWAEKKTPATAWVVRKEKIITAPISGTIKPLINDGERVRVGDKVAVVEGGLDSRGNPERLNISVDSSGYICFHPDGLEKILTPDNLDKVVPEQLLSRAVDAKPVTRVSSGQPFAKIIDNLSPSFLYIPRREASEPSLALSQKVWYRISGQDRLEEAQVVRVSPQAAVLKLLRWNGQLQEVRKADIELIFSRLYGILVPRSAMVEKDGAKGIYIVHEGKVKWKSIEIVGDWGEEIVIKGLEPGTRIILNPGLVREGRRISTNSQSRIFLA